MKNFFYIFICMTLFIAACSTAKDTIKYTIASQTASCTGEGRQQCLLVKKGDATEWEYFYSPIEGFNYEEGFEYVIEVKESKVENPPEGRSSIQYTFVKEVSKTKKNSENLPPAIPSPEAITAKYQWGGKVLDIEETTIGRGAAEGEFPVVILKIEVTSSSTDLFNAKDTIHAETTPSSKVKPVVGREYMFKAKDAHPAHAKGVYMLDTEVLDLI